MALEAEFVVESASVESKAGKDGSSYESLKVVGGGRTYRGYPQYLSFTPKIGDRIKVAYNQKQAGQYTINQIVDMKKLEAESQPVVVQEAPKSSTSTIIAAVSPKPSSGGYDPKGQMRGNAMTNAVNIAIHNAQIEDRKVSFSEIQALSRAIIAEANLLEKE